MPSDPVEYANLRTLLDSLEIGALRYYLNREGPPQTEKFEFLRKKLLILIDEMWGRPAKTKPPLADPCPPGYYNCDGMCVPYECPVFAGDPKPKTGTKPAKRKR